MDNTHPLYNSFAERAAVLEADYRKFKAEFDSLWAKDDDLIGLILKCHLIVEYYMNECLKASFPGMESIEDARLTFVQKCHLLAGWTFGFPWVKKGVRALNAVRNKVAHDIHYEIRDADLEKIYACMDPIYHAKKETPKRGKDAVTDFATFAAMALGGWTAELRRHAPTTGMSDYNELCIQKAREKEGITGN